MALSFVHGKCQHYYESGQSRASAETRPDPASHQNYGYRERGVERKGPVTVAAEMTVTRASIREYLAAQRPRYHTLRRMERRRLLDEIAAVTGYHRKAIIRALREMPRRPVSARPVGRPRRYGVDVAAAARVRWEAAGQIGAKRLHPFIPELLARLLACGEVAPAASTRARLASVSVATLERLLASARHTVPRRGPTTTRPGTWLKQRIPMRTFAEWDDARPGFLEVDLVAHCGHRSDGFYLYTLCAVDVATSWIELEMAVGYAESGARTSCGVRMLALTL